MILDNLSAVWAALGNHLWQSTLFAAVVSILALALHKNEARVRYRLWLAASLKFLVPFSALMSLGSHLATQKRPPQTQAVFYFVMQKVSQPFHQSPGFRGLLAASLLPLLPSIVAALWLGGFVTVIGLWWLRWRRVAGAKRDAVPLFQGHEVNALRQVERSAGLRRPIAFWLSQKSLEPGVFGIVRPVLLWPAGISEHLQDSHLEAILAHEVQHVRRRDNLAAAMHMVVEAIFWFYPLVWWLGARLVEERERACDEEVLRRGMAAQIYAESILKTCAFCVESPLACISGVTGANLKQRIIRIMTRRPAEKLGLARKLLLAAIGLGTVAGPVVAGLVRIPPASAQSPQVNSDPKEVDSDNPIGGIQNSAAKFAGGTQTYHVGGEVSAPKLVYAPDPEYSSKARRANYQGVCVVSVIVDAKGKPQHVQVVRHLGMGLEKKAVEAVKQYKFEPAMLHDKPVAVTVNIEVNFRRY
jgi:bla regulator protein BlaR1